MTMQNPHFSSPYKLGDPNERIEVGQEMLALATQQGWALTQGSAYIRFLPRPTLEVAGTFPIPGYLLGSAGEEQLGLPDRNLLIPGFITSSRTTISKTEGAVTAIEWLVNPQQLNVFGVDSTPVSRAVFHVVNFLDLFSRRNTFETVGSTSHRINHFLLEWREYVVHIRSLPSTPATIKTLRAQGGFAVTHLGEITHKDGKLVTAKEVAELLDGLRLFLSFARGAYSPPILPVGYDANGTCVWQIWNSPSAESFTHVQSWLDSHQGTQLEAIFPSFMERWSAVGWRDAIEEATYWYLNSNFSARGLDAGIILTQTALERLSYSFLVQNNNFLSYDGFNKIAASDRLRLLFASLNISQSIPAILVESTKLAKTNNWGDAPQALTEMRNEKVHPQHKKRGMFDTALYEAWNLGLWYIEMTLLRLYDYRGPYANRLKSPRGVGEVDKVPWEP